MKTEILKVKKVKQTTCRKNFDEKMRRPRGNLEVI